MSKFNWEQWLPTVETASRHIAPALKRSGLEYDDCKQEGWAVLLRLFQAGTVLTEKLVYTAVRRAAVKAARKREGRGRTRADPTFLETCEAKGEYGITSVLHDLIASADPDVAEYMTRRVMDGMTWDECAAATGWSNDRQAKVRERAASWLLTQFEG